MWTSRVVWIGAVQCISLLIAACGGSTNHGGGGFDVGGSGGTVQTGGSHASGGSGKQSGGGGSSSGGTGTGTTASFAEACADACSVEGTCAQVDIASCQSGCSTLNDAYSEECKAAFVPAAECEVGLDCSEFTQYAENPREDSKCGQAYAAMIAACGYSETTPPACTAFCSKAESCEPELTAGGCPDSCNVAVGVFVAIGGSDCGSPVLDLYSCYGSLSCDEMSALLVGQVAPSSCDNEGLNLASCF